MTTTASAELHAAPRQEIETQPVTIRRAINAEWVKFRTLRSSWAVLVAAIVGMIAIALIVAFNTRKLSPQLQPNDLAPSASLQGYYLGQLLIGSLGVLFVTGEYSTGMIRSSFAAIPKRLPVLWAKLVVFICIIAVAMTATSLIAFLSAQGLLSRYRPGFSLNDPHVLRVVIGTGIYLTLVGTLGGAIGWILRNTPGALVAYFATIVVLPILFGNVLGTWGKHVAEFMPSSAGASYSTSLAEPPSLSPLTGLGVLIAWVAAALAVAVIQLRRRDA